MRVRRRFLLLVLMLALAACTDRRSAAGSADTTAPADDGRISRRDSAGVEIVTTAEPLWAPGEGWRLAAEPTLVIADSGLGRVASLTRTDGGAVIAADAERGVVVAFDTLGVEVWRVETVGGRPFRELFWVAAAGDTVLAYDMADRRLVRMVQGGTPSVVTLRPVDRSSFAPLRPLGRFSGGSILAASGGSSFPFPGEEYEVRQDSAVLLRYRPNGRVRDTLAVVPWGESFGVAAGGPRRRIVAPLPRPYGRSTTIAAAGDRFHVGTADRFEIAVRDTAGTLLRLVRIGATRDSLTPEAIDSHQARVRRRVEMGDSSSAALALLRALDHVPYPAMLPAYERLLADPEGRLWVLDPAPLTREAVGWQVFDSAGRHLGVVPMPSRLMVHEIGRGYVLGVWTDDAGSREIRTYPLEKGPP